MIPPAWLFEPKYDGYRGLLYVTRQGCHFRSKRGNVLKRFEQLCYWVREELPVKEAILDGEVVAIDGEGRQNFRDLLAGRGNLHYAAFDALWVNGKDLRNLPLARRKRALTGLVPATTTVASQVFSIEGRGRDLFDEAERLDLEGIVAKREVDPYRPETVWGTRSRAAPTRRAKDVGTCSTRNDAFGLLPSSFCSSCNRFHTAPEQLAVDDRRRNIVWTATTSVMIKLSRPAVIANQPTDLVSNDRSQAGTAGG